MVNLVKYSLEKIEISIPHKLEVVYGLVRPKNAAFSARFREIIAIAFYSPPKSRKKSLLLDHIVETCHMLLSKYPQAGILIGGDKNEMHISPILDALPRTKQINSKPTCNGKILDVLITNLHEFYTVPSIVPAVAADDPSKGSPSDHKTVIAAPLSQNIDKKINEYSIKTTRPLPESAIREFGQWIVQKNWDSVKEVGDPNKQVNLMQNILFHKLDEHFPVKSVKFSAKDKKLMTGELKKLDRQRKREWVKNGKSIRYSELKAKFDQKYKDAAAKYSEKNVADLLNADPGKAYATIKRIGAKPGDDLDDASFDVLEHLERKLSSKESVELIADHFSKISQEFPAISRSKMSHSVYKKLENISLSSLPTISRWAVEKIMKKSQDCA